jgi:hypothetical protein
MIKGSRSLGMLWLPPKLAAGAVSLETTVKNLERRLRQYAKAYEKGN